MPPRPPTEVQDSHLKTLWRRFLALHAGFALAYGFFGSFSLVYLSAQLRSVGARGGILEQLLPVLAASMLLDAIVGPFAGNFADARGRRRASLMSTLFLGLAMVSALVMPFVRDVPEAAKWVLNLGIVMQLLLSLSAAFYATSLDAWWVDLLQDKQFPTGGELQKYFSRQAQLSGLFLVLGGAGPLFFGATLSGGLGSKAGITFGDPGWQMFALGLALCVGLAAVIRFALDEGRRENRIPLGLADELRWKVRLLWDSPEVPRALAATSVVYVCTAAFLYLVPMLLNDASVVHSGSFFHHWIGENYWAFYLCMGVARVLGPMLSEAIRFRASPSGPARRREFGLWARLVCWSLLAAAGAYLLLPPEDIDFALPLLVGARIFAEAFKPVQAAYLNELVQRRSMRAFALSLTTAAGSLFVSLIAWFLMSQAEELTHALESWARPARSVPLLLAAGAVLGWFALKLALRTPKASHGSKRNVVPPLFGPAPDAVQAVLERALEARRRLRGTGLIPIVKPAKPRVGRPLRALPARPAGLRQSRAVPQAAESAQGRAGFPRGRA